MARSKTTGRLAVEIKRLGGSREEILAAIKRELFACDHDDAKPAPEPEPRAKRKETDPWRPK
jgi:hypothetical protein